MTCGERSARDDRQRTSRGAGSRVSALAYALAGELNWPTILQTIRNRGWSGLIEIEHMPVEETAAGERRLIERLRAIDAALS